MAVHIEHGDVIDVRDLAEKAREYTVEFSAWDDWTDEDREDAMDTLNALADGLYELGYGLVHNIVREDFEQKASEFDEPWQVVYGEAIANEWEKVCDHMSPTLIADSYFVEAMKEDMVDLGYVSTDLPPFIDIDWEATAENLRVDFTSITLNGEEYWIR